MLKVRSHCSRVEVNRLPPPPMPALLNKRWILSVACSAISSSRKRLSWSSIETSATWAVMRSPCGSFSASQSPLVSAIASTETSHIATLQPSATSWRTSSRPIPVPPPVTTAIFPAKSFMGFRLLILRMLLFLSLVVSGSRGASRRAELFRGLDAFSMRCTEAFDRLRDHRLLRCGRLGHRRAREGPRQSLQGLRIAGAGRQIVRDDGVPQGQELLVQLQRPRMIIALDRVPQ